MRGSSGLSVVYSYQGGKLGGGMSVGTNNMTGLHTLHFGIQTPYIYFPQMWKHLLSHSMMVLRGMLQSYLPHRDMYSYSYYITVSHVLYFL